MLNSSFVANTIVIIIKPVVHQMHIIETTPGSHASNHYVKFVFKAPLVSFVL